MKVLVIYGGSSEERDLSLRSGQNVGQALIAAGHQVSYFDPGDDTSFILLKNFIGDAQVVVSVLHGKGGEDGAVQFALESLGVPHVGSTAIVAKNCFNRVTLLKTLHDGGIPTPVTDMVGFGKFAKHPFLKQPFVFKAPNQGSNKDTFIIHDPASFTPDAYQPAFTTHGSMLLQPLIEGVELKVGVLDNRALPVVEMSVSPDGSSAAQSLCPAVNVPVEVQQAAQAVALQAHQLMGCRHFSSSDFIWGKDGKLYCLELNVLPDLTPQSPYFLAASAFGVSPSELADILVTMTHQPPKV